MRVAAELADGWFPCLVARDHVAERAPVLGKLRDAAGLRDAPLTVPRRPGGKLPTPRTARDRSRWG